jgi:hypothetical protein
MAEQDEPTTHDELSAHEEATESESESGTGDEPLAAGPPPRRSRSTVVLAAVAAVLLIFGVTMTVLYQRQSSARAARDRAVAARDAQLAALRAQLAALQTQSADLQAKLKAAQDKQLDPAGYEQIKKCVQETATTEQAIAKLLSDPNFPGNAVPAGSVVTWVPGDRKGSFKPSTTCTDAAKYLK